MKNMVVIYPQDNINENAVDSYFKLECISLQNTIDTYLIKNLNNIPQNSIILYRGYMLNDLDYLHLINEIYKNQCIPFTIYDSYINCHYFDMWYDLCKDITANSIIIKDDENLINNIVKLVPWDKYFIKGRVKSNSLGSISTNINDTIRIINEIKQYYDSDGFFVFREYEEYITNSEQRYFVMNDKIYTDDKDIPDIIYSIKEKIASPFYTIDIAKRIDGVDRLIEIGDGQVSDRKNLSMITFIQMIREANELINK